MKTFWLKTGLFALALGIAGTASADNNLGVGVKAGTVGIGVEGLRTQFSNIGVVIYSFVSQHVDVGS